MLRFCIFIFFALSPLSVTAVPLQTEDGYPVPQPGYNFTFPEDHGNHPGFRIEWWYITGHLFTKENRRFGFQATFFRSASKPPNTLSAGEEEDLYLAHMGLYDLETQRHYYEERLNRETVDTYSRTGQLDARHGNWKLKMEEGAETMKLTGSVNSDLIYELELSPLKPLVFFGEDGTSRKGAGPTERSYYITYTRLAATGYLQIGGNKHLVSGTAWMDHEISSDQLSDAQVGWDWASIQLFSGEEIMLYRLRYADGSSDPYSTLVWIDKEANITHFTPADFSFHMGPLWKSPQSGTQYPIGMVVTLPQKLPTTARKIELRPIGKNQENIGHLGGIDYWEGACDVLNEEGTTIGHAYIELTGYSKSISDRL